MNSTQRKYAMERVSTIKGIRESRLRKDYDALRIPLSNEMRASLVRSGEVRLRDDVTAIYTYTDVTDVFDFRAFTGPTQEQTDAYNAAVEALNSEAERVRDRIMLGDAGEAVELLEAFSAGTAAD